jgi:hypothetical protein
MNEAGRRAVHLAAVWCVGGVLTAVQLQVVFIALFVGGVPVRGGLLVLGAAVGLGALARSCRSPTGHAAGGHGR